VLRINGERPTLLAGAAGALRDAVIHLTNPEIRPVPMGRRAGRGLDRRSLVITRQRWVDGGLTEHIRITNHSPESQTLRIDLHVDADAADIFEVRGAQRSGRGRFRPTQATRRSVLFHYDGLDDRSRRTLLSFPQARVTPAAPDEDGSVRIRWTRTVRPGRTLQLEWTAATDVRPVSRRYRPSKATAPAETSRNHRRHMPGEDDPGWVDVQADGELLGPVVHRSLADLELLLNDGPAPGERYLAAGIPWFATLFGRDSLIAAYEALPFRPALAVQTLRVLAASQATDEDPGRDAEPGKILHELRSGEMALAGEIPHSPYYGSIDSTPLWLVLLGETIAWTGDLALLDELWPTALAALRWIDRWADHDGDGFIDYERHAPRGLVNQGWKDSYDAIRDRHGDIAEAPIALLEAQAYVYDARRRMAALARLKGEIGLAQGLDGAADDLRRRVDAAFWVDDLSYYAMARDRAGGLADAIGSNAGHALWSGIVPEERVAPVADRLLGPELNTGWGLRTFAIGQPGYNPIGYHTGAVWPHDTAIAAAGLKRYGRDEEANQLATRVIESASFAPDHRLPELFCGFDRATTPTPVPNPVACSPQAWSAAAPLLLLRTMLGLRADAARGQVELRRPYLPPWVDRATLRGMRIGSGSVDLLIHRWRGTTTAEVLRRSGPLEVVIRI
jgi:glycogen debranching enzyme